MRKGVRFCLQRPKVEDMPKPPDGLSQLARLEFVYEQRKAFRRRVAEFERRLCRAGGKATCRTH